MYAIKNNFWNRITCRNNKNTNDYIKFKRKITIVHDSIVIKQRKEWNINKIPFRITKKKFRKIKINFQNVNSPEDFSHDDRTMMKDRSILNLDI